MFQDEKYEKETLIHYIKEAIKQQCEEKVNVTKNLPDKLASTAQNTGKGIGI